MNLKSLSPCILNDWKHTDDGLTTILSFLLDPHTSKMGFVSKPVDYMCVDLLLISCNSAIMSSRTRLPVQILRETYFLFAISIIVMSAVILVFVLKVNIWCQANMDDCNSFSALQCLYGSFNSSPPCAAYMHQWLGSALVQIMACHLFSAKPLSKPMLGYCELEP